MLAKRGIPLEDLPEANLLQKTDFIPAVEQGVAVDGATGLLAGLVAVACHQHKRSSLEVFYWRPRWWVQEWVQGLTVWLA